MPVPPEVKQKKVVSPTMIGWGCSLTIVLGLITIAILVVAFLAQERETARYPGAIQVSQHSNYKALPREIRWDDSYRTTDSFPKVYNWYSQKFNLGPESRANSRCILIQGTQKQLIVERYTGVMLCDTPRGRMIFVTRSASVRN